MADDKTRYSKASSKYINKIVPNSEVDKKHYDVSKAKELKYNKYWLKSPVNINEVVEQFAPNSIKKQVGYKFIFDGDRYQVIADMVSGSLRILDKKTNQHVKLDGKPGSDLETHFKIKKKGDR